MSFILLLRQSWAFCSSYLTVVSISSIWVSISSISISKSIVSISSIKKSRIGFSLPLHKRVSDKGAGSDSEGASIGVLLHVESRGRDKSGNFMDSSHEVTIVSSLSLVSSNSNRDWEVGGSDFSLELKGLDSIGERKMGSIGVSYDTSIGETTVHNSSGSIWVSIDTSIAMEASIASIEEGGVSLRGSMGSNCQQYTGKYLHCSSVAWLLLTPPSSMLAMLASMAMLVSMDTHMLLPLLSLLLLWYLVTLSQLLLEDTKLLLDPTETLLDPSMRFPDLSLPLLFRSKSQAEM